MRPLFCKLILRYDENRKLITDKRRFVFIEIGRSDKAQKEIWTVVLTSDIPRTAIGYAKHTVPLVVSPTASFNSVASERNYPHTGASVPAWSK